MALGNAHMQWHVCFIRSWCLNNLRVWWWDEGVKMRPDQQFDVNPEKLQPGEILRYIQQKKDSEKAPPSATHHSNPPQMARRPWSLPSMRVKRLCYKGIWLIIEKIQDIYHILCLNKLVPFYTSAPVCKYLLTLFPFVSKLVRSGLERRWYACLWTQDDTDRPKSKSWTVILCP